MITTVLLVEVPCVARHDVARLQRLYSRFARSNAQQQMVRGGIADSIQFKEFNNEYHSEG